MLAINPYTLNPVILLVLGHIELEVSVMGRSHTYPGRVLIVTQFYRRRQLVAFQTFKFELSSPIV